MVNMVGIYDVVSGVRKGLARLRDALRPGVEGSTDHDTEGYYERFLAGVYDSAARSKIAGYLRRIAQYTRNPVAVRDCIAYLEHYGRPSDQAAEAYNLFMEAKRALKEAAVGGRNMRGNAVAAEAVEERIAFQRRYDRLLEEAAAGHDREAPATRIREPEREIVAAEIAVGIAFIAGIAAGSFVLGTPSGSYIEETSSYGIFLLFFMFFIGGAWVFLKMKTH